MSNELAQENVDSIREKKKRAMALTEEALEYLWEEWPELEWVQGTRSMPNIHELSVHYWGSVLDVKLVYESVHFRENLAGEYRKNGKSRRPRLSSEVPLDEWEESLRWKISVSMKIGNKVPEVTLVPYSKTYNTYTKALEKSISQAFTNLNHILDASSEIMQTLASNLENEED